MKSAYKNDFWRIVSLKTGVMMQKCKRHRNKSHLKTLKQKTIYFKNFYILIFHNNTVFIKQINAVLVSIWDLFFKYIKKRNLMTPNILTVKHKIYK